MPQWLRGQVLVSTADAFETLNSAILPINPARLLVGLQKISAHGRN